MKVNWGAIVVAALVHFAFGVVWLITLFKRLLERTGTSPEELHAYLSHINVWVFIISYLCSLGIALVISWVMGMACKFSFFRGVVTGLMVGIVAALAMITEMAFEMRSSTFMLICAAYPLIGSVLMGIIIGVWKPKGVTVDV